MRITNLKIQNKVIISMGYDSITTNIDLTSGHGAILPDPSVVGPYNLFWWNASDYLSPTDDPFVEVVKCIAKNGDTLIVMRSQQQTVASSKNIPGKLYNMALIPSNNDNNLDTLSYYNVPQIHGKAKHDVTTIDGGTVLPLVQLPAHGISAHTGTIGDHIANLTGIGSNTHAQIDTHIGASVAHGVTSNIVGINDTQTLTNKTLSSPSLTVTPTSPTAVVGTNTTQIATTQFVISEIANDAPTKTGGGASGSWGINVTGSSASCTGNAATATNASQLSGSTRDTAYNSYGNGTIPMRHSAGYLFSSYFNCVADVTATTPSHFAIQIGSDNYIRWQTLAGVKTSLAVPAVATTVTSETSFGLSPVVGTSTNYARADHSHGTPATPAGGVRMTSGSYDGNNITNRAIAHGLGSTPIAVFITGTDARLTTIFESGYICGRSAITEIRSAVTAWDATNFYVGLSGNYDYTANWSGISYQWKALG